MRFPAPVAMTAALSFAAALIVASDVSSAAGSTLANHSPTVVLPQADAQASPQIPAQAVEPDESLSQDSNLADRNDPVPLPAPQPAIVQVEEDSPPASSLAALVTREVANQGGLDSEARCLATAVFFEARSESLAGKLAVARVVINRARSGRFPTSLCGVVTQPGQFSFVRRGQMPAVVGSAAQWSSCAAIANIALKDSWKSEAEGALFFHARRVSPSWGRKVFAQVDNHLFYR